MLNVHNIIIYQTNNVIDKFSLYFHKIAASGETTTVAANVLPSSSDGYSTVQQPMTDNQPRFGVDNVPLAPYVPLAPLPDQTSNVPLAASPFETTTILTNPNATQDANAAPSVQTVMPSTSVPLAPLPVETSTQAHLKGAANTFTMFNLSVYAMISVLIANIF